MFDQTAAKLLTQADNLPLVLKVPVKLIVGMAVVVYLAGSLAWTSVLGR